MKRLSKSRYAAFCQCPKNLWLKVYKSEEATVDEALQPDDPELDYTNLDGSVHNGGEAMTIYPQIATMSPADADYARQSLLKYCCLDTLAMVKVWEKLKEMAE